MPTLKEPRSRCALGTRDWGRACRQPSLGLCGDRGRRRVLNEHVGQLELPINHGSLTARTPSSQRQAGTRPQAALVPPNVLTDS